MKHLRKFNEGFMDIFKKEKEKEEPQVKWKRITAFDCEFYAKINESKIPNDIKDDKEFYDKLREVIKFGMDKFDADAIDVWAAIGSHIKFYGGR